MIAGMYVLGYELSNAGQVSLPLVRAATCLLQRFQLLEFRRICRIRLANEQASHRADAGVQRMRSIELLHVHLLTPLLCQLALGPVLVQSVALRPTKRPAALVAGDVIVRLDAVQAAHANRRRDLGRAAHQRRLLYDNLIRFDVTCGYQMATQQLVLRYLQQFSF